MINLFHLSYFICKSTASEHLISKISFSSKGVYLCLSGYQNCTFHLKTTNTLTNTLLGKVKTNQIHRRLRNLEIQRLAKSGKPYNSSWRFLIRNMLMPNTLNEKRFLKRTPNNNEKQCVKSIVATKKLKILVQHWVLAYPAMTPEPSFPRSTGPQEPGTWFSTKDDSNPREMLAVFRDIFGWLNERVSATSISLLGARDAAQNPTMHRTAPRTTVQPEMKHQYHKGWENPV